MDEGSTHQEVDLDDRIGILADLMQKSFRSAVYSGFRKRIGELRLWMVAGCLDELFKGLLAARVVDDPRVAETAFSLTDPLSTFSSRIRSRIPAWRAAERPSCGASSIRSIRKQVCPRARAPLTLSAPTIAPECRKTDASRDRRRAGPATWLALCRAALAMVYLRSGPDQAN